MYTGRFAPSPTGPLHAGSLVAALASWLDARAHGGRWLVRIEDVDAPRCVPGADAEILRQLHALGLAPDEPPSHQSRRGALYRHALDKLKQQGAVFACDCSRKAIELANARRGLPRARHGELIYPGTCRERSDVRAPCAWRLRVPARDAALVHWHDRRLGAQRQNLADEVSDFVLRRADGCWTYQLAVVVDDAAQGITDVVRGEDLADNTPRQLYLQQRLGLPAPRYLHGPLVRGGDGEKLSKQNGAAALDVSAPTMALAAAARTLDLALPAAAAAYDTAAWLRAATAAWARRWLVR